MSGSDIILKKKKRKKNKEINIAMNSFVYFCTNELRPYFLYKWLRPVYMSHIVNLGETRKYSVF